MDAPYMQNPFLNMIQSSKKEYDENPAKEGPVQQDDLFKKFFIEILLFGLDYEYQKQIGKKPVPYRRTSNKKTVVVLGAGAAGLSAAYELAQVGHEVIIIEREGRVGGRIKTIRKPFAEGLHAEVGAMRFPGDGSGTPGQPSHFMADFYIKQFKIPIKPFITSNDECYYNIFGDNIKIKDWNADPGKYCSRYWPGWDANLTPEAKVKVKGIDQLLEYTLDPVKNELLKDLTAKGWQDWIKKWSVISLGDFLRSDQYQDENPMKLRPWTEAALSAYKTAKYGKYLDESVVNSLRGSLGQWYKDPMHTPVDGMDALAKAFMKPNIHGWNHDVYLENNIFYGVEAKRVSHSPDGVIVTGYNTATGKEWATKGDAVIVTFPLTILRHIKFEPPLSLDKQKAIEDVAYLPSSKVALQCRTKFWELPKYGIKGGGHSNTNLSVGTVYYLDNSESSGPPNKRGLLLCYNAQQDSLILGSQSEREAVASAVAQIESLHPEISEEFEVGVAQSWFSDPTAMGCCATLEAHDYLNDIIALFKPEHPIYLAGEAISWSSGWIEGALESGIRAAYQFYAKNEGETLSETCNMT